MLDDVDGIDAMEKAFGEPSDYDVLDIVVVSLFLLATTMLNAYALSKLNNILRAVIGTRCFTNAPLQGGSLSQHDELPIVTIQICCYNEGNVIEDTINAACMVDWPSDKLCVQVLDDSNDETTWIAEAACRKWRDDYGRNCHRLTRPTRIGYKAGNLHYHTTSIQGDFVAMFDADHRCERSFLRRTIPHFYDQDGHSKDDVGLVQCPWAYYNAHSNLLTEYDALNLDMSFVIEQTARHWALGVFGFNGTGGIWRVDAIEAGGGWSWETITEDLDLSYEAYLAGYAFVYLRDVPQQLEVPAGIRAHIQQKFRWTKGYWQVTRKTLWRLLCDPKAPKRVKFEAFFHYTGSVAYALTLFLVLLAPVLSYRDLFSPVLISYTVAPSLVAFFGAICTVFGKVAAGDGAYKTFLQRLGRLRFIPLLFALALGMMVFETYAIYEGLTSDDATFIRTPKEGKPVAGDVRVEYQAEDYENDLKEDIGMENDVASGEQDTPEYDESVATAVSRTWQPEQVGVRKQDAGTKRRRPKNRRKSRISKRRTCLPKLSKKGQKFRINLLNGLAGLIVAAYLFGWCVWLFLMKRQVPGGMGVTDYFLVFLLPLPSFGLLYIHGTFVYQLLIAKWYKFRKNLMGVCVDKSRGLNHGTRNRKHGDQQRPMTSLQKVYSKVFGTGKNPSNTGAADTVSVDSDSELVPAPPQRSSRNFTTDTIFTSPMDVSDVFYPSISSRSFRGGFVDINGDRTQMGSEQSSRWNQHSDQTHCQSITAIDFGSSSNTTTPLERLETSIRMPDQGNMHISDTMPDVTSHHSPVGRQRRGSSTSLVMDRLESLRSLSTFEDSSRSFAIGNDEAGDNEDTKLGNLQIELGGSEHPTTAGSRQGQHPPRNLSSTSEKRGRCPIQLALPTGQTSSNTAVGPKNTATFLRTNLSPGLAQPDGIPEGLPPSSGATSPLQRRLSIPSINLALGNRSSRSIWVEDDDEDDEDPAMKHQSASPQRKDSTSGNTRPTRRPTLPRRLSIRSINPAFGGSMQSIVLNDNEDDNDPAINRRRGSDRRNSTSSNINPTRRPTLGRLLSIRSINPGSGGSSGSLSLQEQEDSQFHRLQKQQPPRNWSTGSHGEKSNMTKRKSAIRPLNPAFGRDAATAATSSPAFFYQNQPPRRWSTGSSSHRTRALDNRDGRSQLQSKPGIRTFVPSSGCRGSSLRSLPMAHREDNDPTNDGSRHRQNAVSRTVAKRPLSSQSLDHNIIRGKSLQSMEYSESSASSGEGIQYEGLRDLVDNNDGPALQRTIQPVNRIRSNDQQQSWSANRPQQRQRMSAAATTIQAMIRSSLTRMRLIQRVEGMTTDLQEFRGSNFQKERTHQYNDQQESGHNSMALSWGGQPRNVVLSGSSPSGKSSKTGMTLNKNHYHISEGRTAAAIKIQTIVRSVLARRRVHVMVDSAIAQLLLLEDHRTK